MRLSGNVFSKTLDMDTGITIVTPNELHTDTEYKVVYLLHGICGNNRTWLDYSMLPVYAAYGNSIYVMPDAGRSFYSDMTYGFKYFTYITDELPKICKNVFNISSKRENTIIMGCSMGGYGALKCALSKPEQYGICAAFSSCCLNIKAELDMLRENGLKKDYIDNFGEQLIRDIRCMVGENYEWKPEYDIVELAMQNTLKPQIYLTCGINDPFYKDHLSFCDELNDLGIKFDFEQWNAQHDFMYFNDALKKAIDKFSL